MSFQTALAVRNLLVADSNGPPRGEKQIPQT